MWRRWRTEVWPMIGIVAGLVAGFVAGFVAVTVAVAARTPLLVVDLAVVHWCDAHRPTPLYVTARVLNYLGQGGLVLTPLALAVAAVVGYRTRTLRPFLPVVAAFALTYLTIGPLKLWTDRAAPHAHIPHPEWLFHDPGGVSYPSGHVANAIVWYGVLAILLRPWLSTGWRRVLRLVPPIVVLATTTYLGFHWVSDGMAGVLLGLALDCLMRRLPWDDIRLRR